MSKLNDLINELCPDSVKYVKIKDCFVRLKGTPITAGKMKEIAKDDGEIKIFAGGKTVINAYEKDISNANIIRVPAVLVQSRGLIDFIYYEKPFTFKNEMWAYTSENKVSVKFLYYILKNNSEFFRKSASGMGSLPQISLPVTEDFKIPFPPLEVQREIVRVLDNFTELTQELTQELTLRKKQYQYYRDKLLTFGDDAEYKTLGEIFDIRNGYTPSKSKAEYWENGTVPWFRMDDIRENGRILSSALQKVTTEAVKNKPFSSNSIIISTSATIGEHALITVDFMCNQRFTCLTLKKEYQHQFSIKFLFYYCFKLDKYCMDNLKKGSFVSVDMTKFNQFTVPVPPIEEQERIVKILDKFDTLCNDLTNGIPAEIQARKKQYEYYRDKLLTFEKLK
ncbi:MAG: restriction endonuclease subunit S [Ruminococcus sp.]|nr:restriction endonuclease subunit S [Ruminococcus sp.]